MSDKANADKLMKAATKAYGHKPSMSELVSFVISAEGEAKNDLDDKVENYNPSQARDDRGRWTDGGGGGGSAAQTGGMQTDMTKVDTSYRGSHGAPNRDSDVSSPGYDVTERGTFPDDVYSSKAVQYYGTGYEDMDRKAFKIVHDIQGKPDAKVTVYRSVPTEFAKEKINPGDWVAITKEYAVQHGESNLNDDYKVLEKTVRAQDIWTDGNSIQEWGYDPTVSKNDIDGIVKNAKGYNPYRDKEGQFASGPGGASIASTNEAADALAEGNNKLATANNGSAVSKAVEAQRAAVAKFLNENGGDVEKFKEIDENWVGNDYKQLEGFAKDGSSKEVLLMHDLQQTYFKKAGIEEVTVYRGVYGEQAKAIKAAIKNGKKVEIGGDYASSWTGYESVAADYADGAAFTAPDKISDSVVIKQTFKAKEVLYSTQVAAFYAGNADDEFIISSPNGFTVDPADIEVIK